MIQMFSDLFTMIRQLIGATSKLVAAADDVATVVHAHSSTFKDQEILKLKHATEALRLELTGS